MSEHMTGEALAQIFQAASDNCEAGVDEKYVGLAMLMAEVFSDVAGLARSYGRRRVDLDILVGPMGSLDMPERTGLLDVSAELGGDDA